MSIRIIQTSDGSLDRNYDSEWRKAQSQIIPDNTVGQCKTPQCAIDAIADAMNTPEAQQSQDYSMPQIEPRSQQYGNHYQSVDNPHQQERVLQEPQLVQGNTQSDNIQLNDLQPSKEQVANDMVQQFIRQNGGIPLEEPPKQEQVSKNKVILG